MGTRAERAGTAKEFDEDPGLVDLDPLWVAVTTLEVYAAMTIEWLRGRLPSLPGYGSSVDVDEEIAPGLTETLMALNNAGFMTTASQAGSLCREASGVRWEQVAAVTGLTTRRVAAWLQGELRGTGFRAVTSRVRRASDGEFYGVPVTWRQRSEYSWFGAVSDLMVVPSDAELALTIYDPVPGPNELWPVLLRAAWARTEHIMPTRCGTP
jgi:hypothetical protein